jgi:hypothetical protein
MKGALSEVYDMVSITYEKVSVVFYFYFASIAQLLTRVKYCRQV